MVLQRDVPVLLRGEAEPGKRVTAVLGDNKATVKAGKDGRWQISLPAYKAGGPYTLQVTAGKEVLNFDDILLERCGYVADSRIWNFVCVQQLMPRRK